VTLDNLTTGRKERRRWGTFVPGNISEVALLRQAIRDYSVHAVLHLAASAHVGDSIAQPEAYFSNNIAGTLALLEAMVGEGVHQLVFASSCSVYGNQTSGKVREHETTDPLSPYGESKLAIERLLPWYERRYGMHWLALRYFNVAGAESDLGEEPQISERIVPRAIHAALGGGLPIRIFGTQFPSGDGTAIRDYVHVWDVARGNLLALQYVADGNRGAVVNIGTGNGVSVREVIDLVGCIAGCAVAFDEDLPRPGDAACLIADPARAWELLGWAPSRSDMTRIVTSALDSHLSRAHAAIARPMALACQ
jgi:UDP-glucose-4-epimerase GalE